MWVKVKDIDLLLDIDATEHSRLRKQTEFIIKKYKL